MTLVSLWRYGGSSCCHAFIPWTITFVLAIAANASGLKGPLALKQNVYDSDCTVAHSNGGTEHRTVVSSSNAHRETLVGNREKGNDLTAVLLIIFGGCS
jgi:hypothetical protein